MLIARAFALSKARLKIVNVCFLNKKKKCISFHYLVNIRKTTLYIGSFFLNAVWLFVYIAIYSKKDDYDAYSQGCAFSKARLKIEVPCHSRCGTRKIDPSLIKSSKRRA
jgi:hypothetical protein